MTHAIASFTLVVAEYDPVIGFYRDALGFCVLQDTDMGEGKRWVVLAPPGGKGARMVLAKAVDARQRAAIGNQAGGRVGFFLETDDFSRDFVAFTANGVHFIEAPRREPYGQVGVFEDLYGNRWDLIEPAPPGI